MVGIGVEVDDGFGAVFDYVWEYCFVCCEHFDQVHGYDVGLVVGFGVEEWGDHVDVGVVDEHVDRFERGFGGGDVGLYVVE